VPLLQPRDIKNISTYPCGGAMTEQISLMKTFVVSGIFITIFTIERFGRKKTMAVQFVVYAVCCCFLVVCSEKRIFLTVMLFLARGIIAGVFQAAYVYTPEVYPTSLRAVGVGSCSAMARLGAMVTPYVAQVCRHIKCVDFSLCEWFLSDKLL
jgi:MFS family permease